MMIAAGTTERNESLSPGRAHPEARCLDRPLNERRFAPATSADAPRDVRASRSWPPFRRWQPLLGPPGSQGERRLQDGGHWPPHELHCEEILAAICSTALTNRASNRSR